MSSELIIGDKIPIFDHIIDNLYLGDIEVVKSNLVKDLDVVVNISNESYYLDDSKLIFSINVDDDQEVELSRHFDNFLGILNMYPDSKVLVHCQNAVSRSVTLVLVYLITKGFNLRDAIVFLKSKRKPDQYTRPNRGFFRQLITYEFELTGINSVQESEYRRLF